MDSDEWLRSYPLHQHFIRFGSLCNLIGILGYWHNGIPFSRVGNKPADRNYNHTVKLNFQDLNNKSIIPGNPLLLSHVEMPLYWWIVAWHTHVLCMSILSTTTNREGTYLSPARNHFLQLFPDADHFFFATHVDFNVFNAPGRELVVKKGPE